MLLIRKRIYRREKLFNSMQETVKLLKSYVSQSLPDTISMQRIIRFGITGVLTAVAYFIVLIAMVEVAGLQPVWAAVIAFCVPLPLNYLLHRNWAFESNVNHTQGGFRYIFTVLTGLGLNALTMYVGATVMNIHYLLVQIAAIGAVITWNFIIFNSFVFHKRQNN